MDYLTLLANPRSVSDTEAAQVFDGVMLSDGGMTVHGMGSYYFQLRQAGLNHRDWLVLVKFSMCALGVYCRGPNQYIQSGDYITLVIDSSSSDGFLATQYQRWYPNKHKKVPADLRLAPVSLANWYMGDGYRRNNHGYPYACFCTDGFARDELDPLVVQIRDLGFDHVSVHHHYNNYWRVVITSRDFLKFVKMVRPLTVPSFYYKIQEPL